MESASKTRNAEIVRRIPSHAETLSAKDSAPAAGQAWIGYLKSLQPEGAAADAEAAPPDGGPVTRLSTAPAVADGEILHLVDAAALATELSKSGARYVHLIVSGQEMWLDLGETPDAQVLADLTSGLVGPQGLVRPGLDPATFFTLDGDDIVAGAGDVTPTQGAGIRDANAVLDESNTRSNVDPDLPDGDPLGHKMDDVWTAVNGGRGELSASDVPAGERTGPQDKPGAWYNGLRIEGDEVKLARSPEDDRTAPLPELSLEEYRQMLVRDFDYNGAITKFKAAGGEPVFEQAVLERYPDRDPDKMKTVAREVWAYATTGMDSHGTTNIAQMQGYLYALDPEIQVNSDSNTEMGPQFNAGTVEKPILLPAGDGAHGRATILTTRHIVENVSLLELEPKRVPTVPPGPPFESRDRFVADKSGSMTPKWNAIVSGVDQTLGQGAFDPTGQRPSAATRLDATFADGADERRIDILNAQGTSSNLRRVGANDPRSEVRSFSVVLQDAYDKLHPAHTRADAEAFAGLFGLPVDGLFDVNGPTYLLNGTALRDALGDVGPGDATRDAGGESSLKAIIATLLYSPQYSDAALANLSARERPRLNAVADEREQSIEYLELAKQLAKTMGIEVRIVAVPTANDGTFDPRTDVAVIDLQSMALEPVTEAPAEGVLGQLNFKATIGGVTQDMHVPVERELDVAFSCLVPQPKPLQRGTVPLVGGQTVVKTQE